MSPATPIITIGKPLIELSEIDSTNIYAMAQIEQGLAVSGSVYQAFHQTQGKGQHGRPWESTAGKNLLCTYILSLTDLKSGKKWEAGDQKAFSAAIALGVRAFFDQECGGATRIKLPNDIYWNDRKAGGILIENKWRGSEWTWAIIGIGVNINQTDFSPLAGNPVSLQQITGKTYSIQSMQIKLAASLNKYLNEWMENGETAILEKLNQYLISINGNQINAT